MAWTSSSVNCSALAWSLLLLLCSSRGSAQLSVITVDTNQPLNPSRIVVGTASDLALQVRCTTTSTSATSWTKDGSTVSQGLNPFGISQEDGVLRVYPVTLLSEGDTTFSCSDDSDSLDVLFDRRPHLFFTSPIPEQAPATTDVITLCPVPDIPTATVTAVNDTGFSYCQVVTERGTFRSRSIITEEEVPSFAYEPLDLESNPFNGNSRAAFSCAVLGIKPVTNIQWYFEMMQFGSGMGPELMDGILTNNMDSVTISSGTDVISSRASVLLLDNVGSQHEGFYRCVVTFADEQTLSSRNASLRFNATVASVESIVLAPSDLTVLEGNTLLVPCVSSGSSLPSFLRVISGTMETITTGVTQLGLEMSNVAITDSGVYTCTVGGVTADVMVTVTPSLFPPDTATITRSLPELFDVPPENIVIDTVAGSARLRCVSPVAVDLLWLMDTILLQAATRNFLIRSGVSTPGFYQCASARTGDSINLYASEEESIYILRAFLSNTALPPPVSINRPFTGSTNINLTCSTEGNPLPTLSWIVNGLPNSEGVQAVTGFMDTASSILTLSIADLSLGPNTVSCTASLDPPVGVDPVTRNTTITVQAAPIITTLAPMDLTVFAGEVAVFNCTVEGFPLPTIYDFTFTQPLPTLYWVMVDNDGNEKLLIAEDSFDVTQTVTSPSTVTSTLTVFWAGITLNGFYRCMASNVLGAVTETAQLTVNRSPVIRPRRNISVLAPEAAVLSCLVEGFPLPTVSWVMVDSDGNQIPITSGGSFAIAQTNTSITLTSNLTISPTDIRRSGQYLCVATNEFGMANQSALLTVNALPNITSPPMDLTVLAPQGAMLSCSVEGFPLPMISWVMMDSQGNKRAITSGENFNVTETSSAFSITSNLTISLSDVTRLGQYLCVATNEFGMANQSALLTVNALPNITSPPMDLTVLAPQGAVLSCSVEGFPLPMISWVMMDSEGNKRAITSGENFNVTETSSAFSITSNLTISPSDVTRLGQYLCVATNEFGMANQSALLTVNALPNITSPPMDLTVLAPQGAVLSCSVEGFPLPMISWVMMDSEGNKRAITSGENFNVTETSSAFSITSNLIISRTDLTSNGVYMCVAINDVGSINASALLTVNAPPLFLVSPVEEVLVIEGEMIALNCTAEGNPLPAITWMINTTNGMTSSVDSDFNITLSNSTFTQTSVLRFVAMETYPLRANGSMPYCVADNDIEMGIESNRTLVTIAGPPLPPNITIVPAARSVIVSLTTPFSLLPITNYSINISESLSGVVTMATISGDALYYNATSLTPNLEYSVSVVALSRAGVSSVTIKPFYTLEDVPDGFPSNVRSTSTLLNSINVNWNPLADNETNGVITGYTVQYISSEAMTMDTVNTTLISATLNVMAGYTYTISVAARTAIGLGPYSTAVSQMTIPVPPTFSPDPPPVGSPGVTTIPITLPAVSGGTFSHYWVVVIRLDDASAFDESRNPTSVYPDNSSFTNYSASVPLTPYIAAEIRADNYQPSMVFILGDESGTRGINDFPDLYRNGPLEQGSTYTAFVRAFSPTVPAGTRARRQSVNRQYTTFSSSPFVTPVGTQISGLPTGAIAGIVVAIVLALIAVLVIIIIGFVLYERNRLSKEYGLPQPPSRKGSVRIRDHREIIPTTTTLRNLKATAELQNLDPEESRNSVLVEDFPRYVKSMHANTDHLYSEEYEILSIKSPSLAHVQSSLPCNVIKNRYANINCFDDTRVRLSPTPGVDGSDYINANYIDGFLEKRGYVATQGPLAHTTHDFWRMVWEQNSCCIIMLTNVVEKNRAKCHQYWPEVGSLTLEDISVTLIEIQQLAYYTVRTFKMSRGNDRREVKQFHYTGWPDFGVPDYPHPVIAFSNRINDFKRTTPGPFIYHCSAGVGRTGTLMTIQAMMQMMEEEGKLDIFNFVLGLRHQRNYMVQTERQYIFIHDCIHETMKVGGTSISIQTLRRRHKELLAHDPHLDTSKMEAEYARLNELQVWEESQLEPARMPVNRPKNRFEKILPYDRFRVRLLLHPGVIGSDYVNASYIDGYQHRHQYILTQGAMKHTVTDFWRMIWEHRVSCILMLCPLEEKGKEQCVRYWPTEKIIQQGDMFIELTQMTDYGSYTMREFSVTNTKINESRVIKHYQYSDWLEDTMPTNAATVIDLIGVLQKSQHMLGGGPIVVHDSSSIGRSATFCILGSVLEQLKVEGIVDLFATIHSLRHQQPGLVNSFELYKFCYQAVLEFLDSFDHYANFD
ncbi:receptor-type tyrosine-protein phosphatase S-like isoform X2 [Halichondria panicea]